MITITTITIFKVGGKGTENHVQGLDAALSPPPPRRARMNDFQTACLRVRYGMRYTVYGIWYGKVYGACDARVSCISYSLDTRLHVLHSV